MKKRRSYWLYLVRLTCHKTEDSIGGDEAYIYIKVDGSGDGQVQWGTQSVDEGETVELEAVTEPVDFRTSVAVSLRDVDIGWTDDDDRLGEHIIRPDANFPFENELELEFTDDEAHYTLTCVIKKSKKPNGTQAHPDASA
jgi:hypothetical protein